MKNSTNKNFWQRFAKIYTAFMSKNDTAYINICEKLNDYMDGNKKVLELACGTGQITFRMADKSASWIATDYSENMVKEAEKRKKQEATDCKAVFEVQDATNLTYEEEQFDVVVIANALHIMPDPNAALKEIHRVLKKDGILFAPTFVYESGYSKPLIWIMEKAGFKTYFKWTRTEYTKYVSQRGFCVEKDVLDEPSANLDVEATEKLRQQILLLKEQGNTIVIAEHRLYFLADLIDRAVYFQNGTIEKIFSGEEFRRLEEKERQNMGLRELTQTKLSLPEASQTDNGNGFLVEGLNCGYEKDPSVIQDLSFVALPGEVLAITGANGAGKTTLTRCLCGLIKERDGKIAFRGQQLKAKQRQKKCFFVMQDVNHQLFYDSVWNECEQAGNAGQIEEILQKFDLLDFKERHPMALSGGQKQRLAVATALLSGKEILIFDEPTSGLDYRHMQEVGRVIRGLAEEGKVVIVVSHDQEFMQTACDRILVVESTRGK